jgi:hypothetical protein
MLVAWGRKLERSPFLVDQVAESERIDEEHRVKLLEEARRMQRFDARKKDIKKEIILRVLAESNAIETLRSEKRCVFRLILSLVCFGVRYSASNSSLCSVFDLCPRAANLHLNLAAD